MRIEDVIKAIAPICVVGEYGNREIQHLLTDSRTVKDDVRSTLFFALRTEKNDGANYIVSLLERGVRNFVVHTDFAYERWLSQYPDACLLVVNNTLDALQDLAAWKRHQYSCPVIGITGSNGKTVVKEWLYELLKDDYKITRSPKSYNSQIGVPLSVWTMNEETELAILRREYRLLARWRSCKKSLILR